MMRWGATYQTRRPDAMDLPISKSRLQLPPKKSPHQRLPQPPRPLGKFLCIEPRDQRVRQATAMIA